MKLKELIEKLVEIKGCDDFEVFVRTHQYEGKGRFHTVESPLEKVRKRRYFIGSGHQILLQGDYDKNED
jgi:hypothetical protein